MSAIRRWSWIAALVLVASLAAASAWLLWPRTVLEFAAVRARFTPSEAYLLDRRGELLDSKRIDFGVRRLQWVPLAAVSPALVEAIVSGEDRRFWQHHGIDWWGATGAVRDQLWRDRRRGASTITMQLASLLEGARRRPGMLAAWRRKLAQVQLAVALERQWSKAQILEAYLNLLEFRGELQGIGAVARVLAQRDPSGLSNAESAVLAALLPDPGAAPERVVARACARSAARQSGLDCDAIRRAADAILGGARGASKVDHLAPQLANVLLRKAGERVGTTLDGATQRLSRDVLARHLGELAARNVRDGAVLVVDNASGDVLAYVGSAGVDSRAQSVDGVRAMRQAGSTLKPFLYGLAIERRYLTAASLLDDSPIHLDTASGVYIPQDYDKDFKGLVSVRTALASSLNVPAVRALVLVGVEAFRDRLRRLGYEGLTQSGEFYGYSLALGSAEVSLWQQAQAYRTLARGGHWSALRIRSDDPEPTQRRELPADASFVVGDILSDRAARALTFGLDNQLNTAFWSAAKTGTSKDMRDNWCIGFSRNFTVAVWVGNFEGDAMHQVSGVTGAAPVWHELMSALHRDLESRPPSPAAGVEQAQAQFSPAVEPPRREWFLAGARLSRVVAASGNGEIARILAPSNGMVIALDPDIPSGRQRVAITVRGASARMSVSLNGTALGRATQSLLWTPQPGAYRLALEDERGQALDSVRFTVR